MKNKILITTIFITLAIFIFGCAVSQNGQKQTKLNRKLNNASPIDKYRIEVAYQVSKNWANIGDKNSMPSKTTSIVFKIMPNRRNKGFVFCKEVRKRIFGPIRIQCNSK